MSLLLDICCHFFHNLQHDFKNMLTKQFRFDSWSLEFMWTLEYLVNHIIKF